ncbi:MAG: dihydroorotase [Spirochaetaceae bacterium]|nr:dihydroorotase [Spirochaetaceae bacterium]
MQAEKVFCVHNSRLVDKDIDCHGAIIFDKKIIAVLNGNFTLAELSKAASALCKLPVHQIEFIDAQGYIVQPAFIDMHAHFRYPGQTEKEDLQTGLSAAVAGGFGTLVLMPNTQPVISSATEAFEINKTAAKYNLSQIYQSVSLTQNFDGKTTSHLDEISVRDFDKDSLNTILLATEDGHDVDSAFTMLDAMKKCSQKGIIVSCHCEDISLAAEAKLLRQQALELLNNKEKKQDAEEKAYKFLQEANKLLALAEDTATLRNLELAAAAGCKIHIAHVSTAESIALIQRAKAKGQQVSCEVTPHHLSLSVKNYDSALRHLVNPPLRFESDRQALIQALQDGTADVIATDHAPHTLQDKANGAPGFSGLETAYALCNSALVQTGYISASKLSALMSYNPARLLGLDSAPVLKGCLSPGYSADLTICNPKQEWTVAGQNFCSKGKYSPIEGRILQGKVCRVFLNGKQVFFAK